MKQLWNGVSAVVSPVRSRKGERHWRAGETHRMLVTRLFRSMAA